MCECLSPQGGAEVEEAHAKACANDPREYWRLRAAAAGAELEEIRKLLGNVRSRLRAGDTLSARDCLLAIARFFEEPTPYVTETRRSFDEFLRTRGQASVVASQLYSTQRDVLERKAPRHVYVHVPGRRRR